MKRVSFLVSHSVFWHQKIGTVTKIYAEHSDRKYTSAKPLIGD